MQKLARSLTKSKPI